MLRINLSLLCFTLLLTGCQNSPFGSTRVPPPPTNSYNLPDSYYPGTPGSPTSQVTTPPAMSPPATNGTVGRRAINFANHEEPVGTGVRSTNPTTTTSPPSGPASTAPPTSPPTTAPPASSIPPRSIGGVQLQGMRINDATSLTTTSATGVGGQVGTTGNITSIAQLPNASEASQVRTIRATPGNATSSTSTPQSSWTQR